MTTNNPRNAGRKPSGMVEVMVRLTPKQAEWLRCKGQSVTARKLIDNAMVQLK